MKKQLLLIAALLISIGLYLPLTGTSQNHRPARPGGAGSWRFLGERVIDFKAEKDLINVTGADGFRKLKFKILDAPVQMKDMKVVFENGEVQDIPLNFKMEQGHESRVIDLKGAVRRIKVVYFNYKTAKFGFKGKGKLILFGEK